MNPKNPQTEVLNEHFSQEDTHTANRRMERCSTSRVIGETMQIKTTLRCHLTPVRVAVINNSANASARVWRKGNPGAALVGMRIGAATADGSMEIP